MFVKEVMLFLCVLFILECQGEFIMPEVTLEAYKPKGFRASIPAVQGIQMFAFHGNLNKPISQVDIGEFSEDFTSPADNNVWSYFNQNLTLKVGDVVHYWVFAQYDKLGYRKDGQKWNVTELVEIRNTACDPSVTVIAGKSLVCQNTVILQDDFSNPSIDTSKWLVEEFIPTTSLDYEFVSYQNKPDICYLSGNRLFIKPKPAQNENQVRGELDLRNGCTRQNADECYFKKDGVFILPPVTSGRIVSLVNFRYGKIEVRAKLPAGDWIYPQIYLEQVSSPNNKLLIAYARGNARLIAHSDDDIGSRLLFGGPVIWPEEPNRSQYLKSKRNTEPYTSDFHTYAVIWKEDQIILHIDGVQYGEIDTRTMKEIRFAENEMVKLVLGVGAGGVNDFPDDFRSGNDAKPWQNRDRTQLKNFFNARNKWGRTWTGDNAALQVEFVKITSL